ncbi:unnamed protein product, partial [Gulo gulo]
QVPVKSYRVKFSLNTERTLQVNHCEFSLCKNKCAFLFDKATRKPKMQYRNTRRIEARVQNQEMYILDGHAATTIYFPACLDAKYWAMIINRATQRPD